MILHGIPTDATAKRKGHAKFVARPQFLSDHRLACFGTNYATAQIWEKIRRFRHAIGQISPFGKLAQIMQDNRKIGTKIARWVGNWGN
jgi:hypothetical protein